MSDQEFPELSCYLLPGHTQTPADAMLEAKEAEALGLGKVWVSERFDVKEAGLSARRHWRSLRELRSPPPPPIFIHAIRYSLPPCAVRCTAYLAAVLNWVWRGVSPFAIS